MKYIFKLLVCFILMSSSCEKENDCHSYIKFINESERELLFTLRFIDVAGNCMLNGEKVLVNETFSFRPYHYCIEKELSNDSSLNIYIVDIAKYNDPDTFYDCDSIAIKNKILRQYILTLEDLKACDFTITYP